MNVFGYGSLMWDEWETKYGCLNKQIATLPGFARDFNKASILKWGSKEKPGPTLGLRASADTECTGMVFEFPDDQRNAVLAALCQREGKSFTLEEKDVVRPDGKVVSAVVPVNSLSRNTFIGDRPIDERARMAQKARGTSGTCADYVQNIHQQLIKLGVHDPVVEEFAQHVSDDQA